MYISWQYRCTAPTIQEWLQPFHSSLDDSIVEKYNVAMNSIGDARDRLHIKMPSYQFKGSQYKNKIISRPSHRFKKTIPLKTLFILNQGPGFPHWLFVVCSHAACPFLHQLKCIKSYILMHYIRQHIPARISAWASSITIFTENENKKQKI